jgi:hypothetical protein
MVIVNEILEEKTLSERAVSACFGYEHVLKLLFRIEKTSRNGEN